MLRIGDLRHSMADQSESRKTTSADLPRPANSPDLLHETTVAKLARQWPPQQPAAVIFFIYCRLKVVFPFVTVCLHRLHRYCAFEKNYSHSEDKPQREVSTNY